MVKQLNSILLIDDDEATNYLHQLAIKKAGCTGYIHVSNNGREALDYLKEVATGKYPVPELIFLDINMPVMDGWEFLEHYNTLPPNIKAKAVLMMLTASINPDDEQRATSNPDVSGFRNKPLNADMLTEIVEAYFSGAGTQ
jgi:CheY-like chemotaxis protein